MNNNIPKNVGCTMVTVLIRATIIYLVLLVALRLTGKRQVGELQISELITTFMISELATTPIQNLSIPLIYSIMPIVVLLCLEVVLSFLATKSKVLKKLFLGNPSVIIEKGVVNQKELARLRIGINELLGELRLKNAADISQVDYAILEQNGQLSVFLKRENQPLTLQDVGKKENSEGICHGVVVDGEINESNLSLSGKNQAWLLEYVRTHNINMKEILLMTINDNGKVSVIYKEIE